jgi:hypothetical protein
MNAENQRFESPGEPLIMWTIFDHPSDYPNNFVARECHVMQDGKRVWGSFMLCPHIEPIREQMRLAGLTCIGRQPEDDPVIIEVWL